MKLAISSLLMPLCRWCLAGLGDDEDDFGRLDGHVGACERQDQKDGVKKADVKEVSWE